MTTLHQARALALALPDVEERDHHGRASFRAGGRIFATVWDQEHLNVMVDEPGIRSYVARDPEVYAEVWWGRRLAAVRARLERVSAAELGELLADAWEGTARGSSRAAG
jgi:hypothetical protein